MNTQPEAIRLAKILETEAVPSIAIDLEAAAELRRLHGLNAELLEALLECVEDSEQAVTDYVLMYGEKYRPQRLEAMRETVRKARAAIAKAENKHD